MGWGYVLETRRSECAAALEEDEDDSWTGNGDHRQGGKVGDQVKVKAHGDAALSKIVTPPRLRGSVPRATAVSYTHLTLPTNREV